MENYNFGDEGGWDMAQLPPPDTMLFDDELSRQENVPSALYDLDDALAEYTMDPTNASTSSRPYQALLRQRQMSHRNSPPEVPRRDRRTMALAPMPTQRRRLRAVSPDATERRRRQNRASQLAFRERSRKKMDDLNRELSASNKQRQHMHQTMKDLLHQAEALKSTIERALISFPPVSTESLDSTSAEYFRWSPSDSEGPPPAMGSISV